MAMYPNFKSGVLVPYAEFSKIKLGVSIFFRQLHELIVH
jgi:hypothetical protein